MNLVGLASRLREIRSEKGLTLDELSAISGLAKGLISKVENFRVTPSLQSLIRLSSALEVPMSDLFDGLEAKPELSITRFDERKETQRNNEQSDIRYFAMCEPRGGQAMAPFELKIPPGGGRKDAMPHEGEEFLTILEGKAVLQYGETNYDLSKGDSVYFNPEIEHRIFNPHHKEARVLCVFLADNRRGE